MLNIQKNNYSRSSLDIDTSAMRSLEKLDYKRPWLDLFFLYFQIIVVVYLSVKLTLYSYYFYPLVIFFIAGRQGAFLQLIHEASHNLISNNIFECISLYIISVKKLYIKSKISCKIGILDSNKPLFSCIIIVSKI